MIFIYRPQRSTSARELARAVGGRRIFNIVAPRQGDKVICWGVNGPVSPAVLNAAPLRNKYEDALKLREAGVPTIEVARIRPLPQPIAPRLYPPLLVPMDRAAVLREIAGMQAWLAEPEPISTPDASWIGRLNHHVGGNDLLNPPERPDYYVKRESIVREYRVHSFRQQSIRAGQKTHRDGVEAPHQWIRSWDGGWRISYDGERIRQRHRDLAHQAVAALGLDFGAVDLAEREDRSIFVLEVNRAPGLEGGTIDAYANAVMRWANGPVGI